jgi:CubicO group peptidase (beta-lactamase class C family)
VWAQRLQKRRAAKQRKPVDSWPPDLLFFFRATELLHGLGSVLAVSLRYLDVMAPFAAAAVRVDAAGTGGSASTDGNTALRRVAAVMADLRAQQLRRRQVADAQAAQRGGEPDTSSSSGARGRPGVPAWSHLSQLAHAPTRLGLARAPSTATAHTPLEADVVTALAGLHAAGLVTGCQVVVLHRGVALVDVAFGELGALDPRPVGPATLFNCFSVTKGVVAATVHALMERLARLEAAAGVPPPERTSYDTRVAAVWPGFVPQLPVGAPAADVRAAGWKADCSLAHVLTHSAGLAHALPASLSMPLMCSAGGMAAAMEAALPSHPPGAHTSYHYLTFGWLAAGILRGLSARAERLGAANAGGSVGALVQELVARPCGLEGEMFVGLPAEVLAAAGSTPRLATLWGSAANDTSSGAGTGTATGAGAGAPGATTAGALAADGAQASVSLQQRLEQALDMAAAMGGDADPAVADARAHAMADARAAVALMQRLADKAYLMDPRLFNRAAFRAAEIPAANGHFSARALAGFYSRLGAPLVEGGRAQPHGETAAPPALVPRERLAGAVTYRAVEMPLSAGMNAHAADSRAAVHWGLGFQLYPHAARGLHEPGPHGRDGASHSARGNGGDASGDNEIAAVAADAAALARRVVPAAAGTGAAGARSGASRSGIDRRASHAPGVGRGTDLGTGLGTGLGTVFRAFGHTGLGGSVALFDAGADCAVAVAVNQLSGDRAATRALLAVLRARGPLTVDVDA